MKPIFHNYPDVRRAGGFTLLELLIVVAILGILAAKVTVELMSYSYDLKRTVFSLRANLQLARAEAVSRAKNVYTTFVFATDLNGDGVPDAGYSLWVDVDGDGVYAAGTDIGLKNVPFPQGVEFYDVNAAGGPATTPPPGNQPIALVDGVEDPAGNQFRVQPDGTCQTPNNGYVYLYVPDRGSALEIAAGPYAIEVNPVGSVQVSLFKNNLWYGR